MSDLGLGQIQKVDGEMVKLSVHKLGDDSSKIDYLVNKVLNLRIFDDEFGVMNKSILDIGGNILSSLSVKL